jgi:hypothetical protein
MADSLIKKLSIHQKMTGVTEIDSKDMMNKDGEKVSKVRIHRRKRGENPMSL